LPNGYVCWKCTIKRLAEARAANQRKDDEIAHLRISEAGWLNEYKQSQKQLAEARAECERLRDYINGRYVFIQECGVSLDEFFDNLKAAEAGGV
jgi:hypothetical protein